MATPWKPPPGRHTVLIGQSLNRALKARRGEPTHTKSKIPDKEFYSFRYNFKPGGVDVTKPGSIEVRKGPETTSVVVERGSEKPDETYLFNGQVPVSSEQECILIYDEDTCRFTLEKIDSWCNLFFDRKTTGPRHPVSPAVSTGPGTPSTPLPPVATPTTSRPSPSKPTVPARKAQEDADFDLEKELLAGLDDAYGSPEEDVPLAAATKVKTAASPTKPPKAKAPIKPPPRKEEEEESEGEILEAVEAASKQKPKARAEPVPTPAPKAKPAPVRRPGSGLPPKPVTTVDPPVPKARPLSSSQTKAVESKKRPAPDIEEEIFNLALPTPPAKRARPSPPPAPPAAKVREEKKKEKPIFSLALPTSTPAPTKAQPPTPLSFPGSGTVVTLPGSSTSSAPPGPALVAPAPAPPDSDEEDWLEVQPPAPPAPRRVIEMEEIVPTSSPRRLSPTPAPQIATDDGDEDDFEMEEVDVAPYRGEDDVDDFLLNVVSPVQETVGLPGSEDTGNENLFGEEVDVDVEDDEYSSSEDSDED